MNRQDIERIVNEAMLEGVKDIKKFLDEAQSKQLVRVYVTHENAKKPAYEAYFNQVPQIGAEVPSKDSLDGCRAVVVRVLDNGFASPIRRAVTIIVRPMENT